MRFVIHRRHLLASIMCMSLVGPAVAQEKFVIPLIVTNASGAAKPFGDDVLKGAELAIEEANAGNEVPNVTVELEVHSTAATNDSQAVNAMNGIVKGGGSIALFGTSAASALAIAPIAQRSGLPFVAMQAGSDGLMKLGDHIFRTTAPQFTYQHALSTYFKSKGVKKLAIIVNADNPTLTAVAHVKFPELAAADGYEIVKSIDFSGTETNFQPIIRQVIAAEPDAILYLAFGPQNASIVSEVRLAGFGGILATHPGGGTDVLISLGEKADGIVYAADFSPAASTSAKFVALYQAKHGATAVPNSFHSAGYDGARFIIEGLKVAKSRDRDGIFQGLNDVAAKGFDGAGTYVTFEDRDARVTPTMVEWRNGKENLIP